MRRIFQFGLILLSLVAGCGKDDPQPPAKATLVFPDQNSECTTGVSVNDLSSEVEFRWNPASGVDTYELRVINLLNGVSQTRRTTETSAVVPLQKGTPFSWQVIATNSVGVTESDVWRFYNAGSQTSYAPFPATILKPGPGSSVRPDGNGLVILEWNSSDVDNDLERYQVYIDTVDPPVNLAAEPAAATETLGIALNPGAVYYWKVISMDRAGNRSDSGVYSFKVL